MFGVIKVIKNLLAVGVIAEKYAENGNKAAAGDHNKQADQAVDDVAFARGSFFFVFRAGDHFNHAPDENHGGKHEEKSNDWINDVFFYVADQVCRV